MDNRPWWQHKRYGLLLLVSTYLLSGFFLVPEVAERRIERFAVEQLELSGEVADAEFNPLTYRFELTEASFRDGSQRVIGLDGLVIDFDPLTSLFDWGWSFGTIELNGPYLYLHALEDGRFNWQNILARLPAETEPAPEPAGLPRLQLAQLQIDNGLIEYREDRASGAYEHQFSPIDFSLAAFSTLPEHTGPYRLTAVTESGATIRWTGDLGVQPVRLEGEAGIEGVQLAEIDQYLGPDSAVRLHDGTLSLQTRYRFQVSPEPVVTLSEGRVELLNPLLRDAAEDAEGPALFRASRLAVEGLSVRGPTQVSVAAQSLTIDEPHLQVVLEPDGQINWTRLFIDPESEDPELPIRLERIALSGGAVDWVDRTHPQAAPVPLRELAVGIQSLTLPPSGRWPFSVATQVGSETPGQVQLAGAWDADAGRLQSEIDIKALPLTLANDYLADMTHARWSTGTAALSGRIEAAMEPAALRMTGRAAISGAALLDRDAAPVVTWEDLQVEQVTLDWPSGDVVLDTIAWRAPYVRLLIAEGYRTNLGDLLVTGEEPQATPEGGEQPGSRFAAGPITIEQARMDFEDRNVPGTFTAAIRDLGGSIGRLDSADPALVPIQLSGVANQEGKLAIDGGAALFGEALAADVTMDFQNLALVPLSPYAVKFAGYRIDQGKLALTMNYEVSDGTLSGNNHAVLDQFRLGEKVPSESAIAAPIELAVALLKNDQGVIDIEIPVSGDLASPEFSLGSVIRQAIGSAIGGIVSAPFRFLANLVGGREEDLQQVGFEPGNEALTEAATANLQQLAKALQQRPQLRLEIRPGWSPVDREALIRQTVDARVAAAGGDPQALVASRPALEEVFVATFSEADRLALATAHTTPGAESEPGTLDEAAYTQALYRRVLEQTQVDDAALVTLAGSRADRVSAAMQELGIAPERLFILDVQTLEAEDGDLVLLPLAVSG